MILKRVTKDILWIIGFSLAYFILTHNSVAYPKLAPEKGSWSIEKLQRPIAFRLAGHDFLVLRNANGEIVSELHGLATDTTTNTWRRVGVGKGEVLRVWEFDGLNGKANQSLFPGITLIKGDEQLTAFLWEKAKACANRINEKNIPYPSFGVSMHETQNSNAVAYTLTECMGLVAEKRVGLIVPGSETNLLEEASSSR
jgi:hypothetical protein